MKNQKTELKEVLNRGSEWRRWEPHIHAPGTVMNNQFKGPDAWEDYLTALETASPKIEALGITDYYLTHTYEEVLAKQKNGRLKDILVFLNIELRLSIATTKSGWVNMHLMVSPEDPDHLERAKAFVRKLSFRAHRNNFSCDKEGLISLGYASDSSITSDDLALTQGASQFKVEFNDLRGQFDKSDWASENIFVAVAGSKDDGTSGVNGNADATLRKEIERFANIIFSSSVKQREFWLGLGKATVKELVSNYGELKPCMHGSDAHRIETVAKPDENRFCWIKGGAEFDALRQACIDPVGRAYVGETPPRSGAPSQLIDEIELCNAPWAETPRIAFNRGLVAVIGARGSGKTALADIVATVCDAVQHSSKDEQHSKSSPSFLSRASDLLGDATVKATWHAGETITRHLGKWKQPDSDGQDQPSVVTPRARYLSQQFVEDLCSSVTMTDGLLREIERVIYESHALTDREGALDFRELLEFKSARVRQARKREQETIVGLSDRISMEYEQDRQVPQLESDITSKEKLIRQITEDRGKLVVKGSEERMNRVNALSTAAEEVRGYLRYFNQQKSALEALSDEVKDLRDVKAPEMLRGTQERHKASQIKNDDWELFKIDYTGDVNAQIDQILTKCESSISKCKGVEPTPSVTPETVLISEDAVLNKQPLSVLEAEISRLSKLVAADKVTKEQFSAYTSKISTETTSLTVLREKLEVAKGAKLSITKLDQDRNEAYTRVFDAITSEQNILLDLYAPLLERLSGASGALSKMSFTVSRVVDVDGWAGYAEKNLIDLRRGTPFKGAGTFLSIVEDHLKDVWETGDAKAVGEAMARFREKYISELFKHANVTQSEESEYREWLKQFAKWLYSTDHISLQYGIDFDGVDIRKTSPGTRGIVLLLLYLALDDADTRPLIIDQPEENLDPKSVYDELVDLFIAAKAKRQVIMVTHNANLVINTDADQIIIANAESHTKGKLPRISYVSGGLENADIRRSVCDILEGGEEAFRERARRLRVRLKR